VADSHNQRVRRLPGGSHAVDGDAPVCPSAPVCLVCQPRNVRRLPGASHGRRSSRRLVPDTSAGSCASPHSEEGWAAQRLCVWLGHLASQGARDASGLCVVEVKGSVCLAGAAKAATPAQEARPSPAALQPCVPASPFAAAKCSTAFGAADDDEVVLFERSPSCSPLVQRCGAWAAREARKGHRSPSVCLSGTGEALEARKRSQESVCLSVWHWGSTGGEEKVTGVCLASVPPPAGSSPLDGEEIRGSAAPGSRSACSDCPTDCLTLPLPLCTSSPADSASGGKENRGSATWPASPPAAPAGSAGLSPAPSAAQSSGGRRPACGPPADRRRTDCAPGSADSLHKRQRLVGGAERPAAAPAAMARWNSNRVRGVVKEQVEQALAWCVSSPLVLFVTFGPCLAAVDSTLISMACSSTPSGSAVCLES
jgi:hypothetical protein